MLKRVVRVLVLFAVVVPAVFSHAQEQPPTPVIPDLSPAVIELQLELAEFLGVEPEEIAFKGYTEMSWRDACLGVYLPDERCRAEPTPGYRVVYVTPLGDYDVHLDATGERFRLAAPIALRDNEWPAFIWKRQGGIAGICQLFIRAFDNRFVILNCGPREDIVLAEGVIEESEEEAEHREDFFENIAPFQWEFQVPPNSADMIEARYVVNGRGEEVLSERQQENLSDVLAELVNDLLAMTTPVPVPSDGSGIEGLVTIGPMCPVVREDEPCPDEPYQAVITVFDASGQFVTSFMTDVAGRFRVTLQPGTYTLRPESPNVMPFASEQVVTVAAGRFTEVSIAYDSGIR